MRELLLEIEDFLQDGPKKSVKWFVKCKLKYVTNVFITQFITKKILNETLQVQSTTHNADSGLQILWRVEG
jgi:hypothetical protein